MKSGCVSRASKPFDRQAPSASTPQVECQKRIDEEIRGGRDMSITSSSLPFTEILVAAAPAAPGVFALWQGGGIVYYGRAVTIRIALDEQLRARSLSAQRVTGCSWEIAPDPERRHGELLREYAAAHHALPLWNDPQRLPTA
jgi:hypothetical protein